MKRTLKIILIAICLLFLLRGQVFRLLIYYVPVQQVHLPNEIQSFSSAMSSYPEANSITIEKEIRRALNFTSQALYFTLANTSMHPLDLLENSKANCVGYGNFFKHRMLFQLEHRKLEGQYEVQQWRGKLYLLGWDLHTLFEDPFWKDHDFNIIIDKKTGAQLAVDATLFDYSGIKKIRLGTVASD